MYCDLQSALVFVLEVLLLRNNIMAQFAAIICKDLAASMLQLGDSYQVAVPRDTLETISVYLLQMLCRFCNR